MHGITNLSAHKTKMINFNAFVTLSSALASLVAFLIPIYSDFYFVSLVTKFAGLATYLFGFRYTCA